MKVNSKHVLMSIESPMSKESPNKRRSKMMCKIICYSKYLSHAQKQSEKKYDKLEIAFLTQNAEAVIAISLVWIRHFVSYDVMKSKYGGTRR